uniref:Mediator of RNA polymerase II transcription subunit 15 n=1 Tax=Glossina palpalis gambiensis TaxID=67801 RepID=A0A1B0BFG4_9MUSC
MSDDWQDQQSRQKIVTKIKDMLRSNDKEPIKSASLMENHIFSNSKTKDEYLSLLDQLYLYLKEMPRSNYSVLSPLL